jgi:hypothetical protein
MVSLALVLAFLRFIWVWQALRQLLRQLARHPLRLAYEGLRGAASGGEKADPGLPKIDLARPTSSFTTLAFSLNQAQRLWELTAQLARHPASLDRLSGWVGNLHPALRCLVSEASQRFSDAQAAEAQNNWRKALRLRCQAQSRLVYLSLLVAHVLEPGWSVPGPLVPLAAPLADETQEQKLKAEEQAWRRQAEYFLASRVVAFLHHIFAHLHNLVVFVTSGLLLMLLAVTSYPFQPRDLLLLFNWLVVLSVVGVTLVVFVQMSRDQVLSVLSDTAPGQVEWNRDFISRVFLHALVPILALLGAQFPEAMRWLLSLVGGLQK